MTEVRDGRTNASTEPAAGSLEAFFAALSDKLDALDADVREVVLVKAFLLLAEAHGELDTALSCLEEAAGDALRGAPGSGSEV